MLANPSRYGQSPTRPDLRVSTGMRQSDHDPSRPRPPLAPDPSVRRLTPRERDVALLVAEGLKDILIARRLGLSLSTVSNYVRRVQRRLGLGSRAEIVAWVAARRIPDSQEFGLRRADVDRST
jgi:DNA-binding CsgD family transcriptional regulator